MLVDQHDPQLVWGSSSALSGADSLLSSQFLLDDHHDPLPGLGLQSNWLDNIHIPGGDHACVGKVSGGEFGINFDASAASAIDSVDLGIDWSQLSADLADSHNSSLNALHTHGDFISQSEFCPRCAIFNNDSYQVIEETCLPLVTSHGDIC